MLLISLVQLKTRQAKKGKNYFEIINLNQSNNNSLRIAH